jgi:hypothetical protein
MKEVERLEQKEDDVEEVELVFMSHLNFIHSETPCDPK